MALKNGLKFLGSAMALAGGLVVHSANAQTPPVIYLEEGAQVTPSAAASNTAATHTDSWAVASDADIDALARSLKATSTNQDEIADRIYEYIHNTVQTLPTYGLKKGARGALIDKKGTALDQADLMVQLLRSAGSTTAKVRLVTLDLSFTEMDAWYGVSAQGDICRLLKAGGIPFDFSSGQAVGDCSSLTAASSVKVLHAVVENNSKYYDPAYKIQNRIAGIDLTAAMGFSQNAFDLAAQFSRGVMGGVGFVSNASVPAAFEAELQARSEQLVKTLRDRNASNTDYTATENYKLSTTDVVGGFEIAEAATVEGSGFGVSSITSLPNVTTSHGSGFVNVPDQYRTKVTFTHNGGSFSAYLDEMYGKRLWVQRSFDDSDLYLFVGAGRVWTQSYATAGAFQIEIDHPYGASNGDHTETFNPPFAVGDSAAIVLSSGYTGVGYLGRLIDGTYQGAVAPSGVPSGAASTEALAQISLAGNYLTQQSQLATMMDGAAESDTIIHDVVGMIAGDGGDGTNTVDPHIDIRGTLSVRVDGNIATQKEAIHTTLMASMSVLEASVADQSSDTEASATKSKSAASLFVDALKAGNNIYSVPTNSFHIVRSSLSGYSTALLDRLDNTANTNDYTNTHELIIPQAGNMSSANGVTTVPIVAIDVTGGSQGYIVNDSSFSTVTPIKGTFSDDITAGGAVSAATNAVLANVGLNPDVVPSASGAGFGGTDLVTGAGAFPYALPFRRSFSSGVSAAAGWTHNYDVDASYGANGLIALGSRRPVEATRAIAALYASYKYLEACTTNCSTAEKVVVASIMANWMQNALVDNALNIRSGASITTYAKLADGSFYAPGGETGTVTVSGNQVTIEAMSGQKTIFERATSTDRNFEIKRQTWPFGIEVNYTVSNSSGGSRTVTVSNNIGRSLTIVRGALLENRTFRNFTVTDENNNQTTLVESGLSTSPAVPYTSVQYNGEFLAAYYFDGDGRIYRIRTDEEANKSLFSYNALGQLDSSTLADRGTTTYYNNDWRSETAVPGGGGGVSVADPYGRFAVSIDALGNQARTELDRLGRVTLAKAPEDENNQYSSVAYIYDRFHHQLSVTSHSKGANNTPVESLTSTFTYYDDLYFRQLHTATDPLGRVTTFEYRRRGFSEGAGRMTKQTSPAVTVFGGSSVSPVTSYHYTDDGLLTRVYAPDGSLTQYIYNNKGLPYLQIQDPFGLNLRTNFTYTDEGDLETVDDYRSNGAITTYTYDDLRRPLTTSAPGVAYSKYVYDGDGRVEAMQLCDAANLTTCTMVQEAKRTYDGAGRVLSVSTTRPSDGAALNTTNVAYDDANRTITVTDPRGVQQRREFDVLGRTQRVISNYGAANPANRIVEEMAYRQDGTLDYVEDGRDTKTFYQYDHYNRLKKTDYFGAQDETIDAYDSAGRPTQLTTRGGDTITLAYNDLNWVTTRTITHSGGITTYAYEYDVMGRVRKVTHSGTGISTQYLYYAYDSLGRKLSEKGAYNLETQYVYNDTAGSWTVKYNASGSYAVQYNTDALGRVDTIKVGSHTVADYGYDPLSRINSIVFGNGSSQTMSYETDTGWLESLSLDVSGTADDVTFTYTRDDLGRITGESISNDTYAFKAHKFTNGQVNYDANENNQYMVPADVLHGYDLNGNLTDDGNYQYSYDSENRLTEARKYVGGTSATVLAGSYEYDALGRRSQKTNHVQGNVTTRYQYDGAQVLAEYNDNMVMQRRYVYGPGIDNPLMVQEADGTRRYLHRDGKGSIIAATSSNNSVYAKFTADVWGFGADEATSPYRFTARRMDEETGNYYYRNRYYHTDSGRFMSNDPIGYGDGLNMYAYVSNDPVNRRDPFGLSSEDDDEEGPGEEPELTPVGGGGSFAPPPVIVCPPGTTASGYSGGVLICTDTRDYSGTGGTSYGGGGFLGGGSGAPSGGAGGGGGSGGEAGIGLTEEDTNCDTVSPRTFGKRAGLGSDFVSDLKGAFSKPVRNTNNFARPSDAIRNSIGRLLINAQGTSNLFERSNVIVRAPIGVFARPGFSLSPRILNDGSADSVSVESLPNTFAFTHTHTQPGFTSQADVQTAINTGSELGAIFNTTNSTVTLFKPNSRNASDGAICTSFKVS